MKQVSQAVIDARAQGKPRINLLELHFSQGTVYATDAPFDVNVMGNNYLSGGSITKISEVATKTRLVNTNKSISLSGADEALVALVVSASQINREVIQYVAYLNDDFTIIDSPFLEWVGVISDIDSDSNPLKPKLNVKSSSIFDDFDRRVNRTTSLASQQAHFPNDTAMRFASETKKEIKWGFR